MLAGVPPAVLGLVAKVVALRPVVDAGLWVLVGVAVVAVVLGLAVYLRWFAVLLAHPSEEPGEQPAMPPRRRALEVVLVTGTGLLVVLSVVPGLLLGLLG